MRLVYVGKQEIGEGRYIRLWNVFDSPRPELHPSGSTVSQAGIAEMGVRFPVPLIFKLEGVDNE